MDITTILATILPLILQIINKPTDTPQAKAEMLAIGNDLLALGIATESPALKLSGQYVICTAKADEAGKTKLLAIANGIDRMAKAAAERAADKVATTK